MHLIGSRVETSALSSYGSTGFNLHSPTAGLPVAHVVVELAVPQASLVAVQPRPEAELVLEVNTRVPRAAELEVEHAQRPGVAVHKLHSKAKA
jgi:hypothetical protein